LFRGGVAREIEIQIHRLLQILEYLLGAGAQGVELVLRQVEPHAAQGHIRQHHDT
jgi:hypothetical protein